MEKISVLFLFLGAVSMVATAQSRVEHLIIKSELLGAEKVFSVYLPDGYDKSDEKYPVLYLLHGAKGTNMSWLRDGGGELPRIADEEMAAGRAQKMIIVLPDARGEGPKKNGPNMGYMNIKGWPYEDFFFQEFIPHIDKSYRTIATKEGRAIAGLSMGGGGAVVYSQRHPDMFSACYSTSGLLDIRYHPKNPDVYEASYLWSVTHTSPVEFLRTANDEQIAALRTVRWMVDCGDDDAIIKTNLDFFIEMMREDVKMEFRVRDGNHNWKFWRVSLPEILSFVFKKE